MRWLLVVSGVILLAIVALSIVVRQRMKELDEQVYRYNSRRDEEQ